MAIVSIAVDPADTAFSRLLSQINERMLVRDGSELQELDRGDGTSEFGIYNVAWGRRVKTDLDIFDIYALGDEFGVCTDLDHRHRAMYLKAIKEATCFAQ